MLKKLGFGREPILAKSPAKPADGPARLARQREMVRVAVKGTLAEWGLGATWVGSAANPGPDGALAIHLIVQEWRSELLPCLPALQRRILESIVRIAPGEDHSRHVVSWQFAPDCGCPVTDLPHPASWGAKAAARTAPAAVQPASPPKFDLPASDRDQLRDVRDDIPSTFAATEPDHLPPTSQSSQKT
jgi:hypothetical protein